MVETTTHETINMHSQLNQLINEINQYFQSMKCYFTTEICEREIISKTICKYIADFDYVDKTLLVLS